MNDERQPTALIQRAKEKTLKRIRGDCEGAPLMNLQKPWRRIRKRAGLDDVRLHDLRHSFASVAVSGGLSLPMIGRLLGHYNVATTHRYAHLVADPLRAADRDVGTTVDPTRISAENRSRGARIRGRVVALDGGASVAGVDQSYLRADRQQDHAVPITKFHIHLDRRNAVNFRTFCLQQQKCDRHLLPAIPSKAARNDGRIMKSDLLDFKAFGQFGMNLVFDSFLVVKLFACGPRMVGAEQEPELLTVRM